ncbi:MAG: energy-coupling factor transporter transmembrane protein EcfT [Anaerolineaceae bacterium]|nr:energy-coupling factor transporter transmembrane protein EcfT [Anaerolineaceae bacterium]
MNDFDFLRNLPFGQYMDLDIPLERTDCRARILAFVFILAALTLTHDLTGLVFGLAVILVSLFVLRFPMRFTLRGLISPLPFLIILALLQVFFNARADEGATIFQIGSNVIATSDLMTGAILLIRFVSLILGLTIASQTLSTSEITHGMESLLSPLKLLRFPVHDLVVIIQVSLRFIPLLAQVAERIAKAQASRGAAWQKGSGGLWSRVRLFIPLLLPLFLTSLRRAENMALAMDARGYGTLKERSSLIEYRFGWKDALFVILSAGVAALILFFPL